MKHFVAFLIFGVLAYLLGAFVAADFNIASWPTDGRFFVAMGGPSGAFTSWMWNYLEGEDNRYELD